MRIKFRNNSHKKVNLAVIIRVLTKASVTIQPPSLTEMVTKAGKTRKRFEQKRAGTEARTNNRIHVGSTGGKGST